MSFATALQTVWVFIVYSAVVLLLPAIAFPKKLRIMKPSDRFMFCCVVGNFWLINAVLFVMVLRLGGFFVCLLFTYGLALVLNYLYNRKSANAAFKRFFTTFRWLLRGELRGWLYFKHSFHNLRNVARRAFSRLWAWIKPHGMELLLLLLCFVGNLWFLSYQSLHEYNLGTSDVMVHATWVNAVLDKNRVFTNGVYPFGYHCILYFVCKLTGFDSLFTLRVMGTVQSLYIFMMLYLMMRSMCKSKYSALIAFAMFSLTSAFVDNAMMRYQWALPQEYAMLFLYPMGYYLSKYLRQYREHSRAELKAEAAARKRMRATLTVKQRIISYFSRASGSRSTTLPLLLSSICVSMTIAIHFYVTIAAAELFLAMMLANIRTLFKPQCLRRLVCYMMVLVIVAFAPMVFAYATGTQLEASLLWGMSIVEDYEGNSTEVNQEPYKSLIYDVDIQDPSFSYLDRAVAVVKSALSYIKYALSPHQWYYATAFMIAFAVVFSTLGMVVRRKSDYVHQWFVMMLYVLLLISIVKYPMLGFPALMEGSRASIFLAYSISVLYAYPFDLLFCLLTIWKRTTRACNALFCAACCFFMGLTQTAWKPDLTDALTMRKHLAVYYHFQYRTAITLIYDLINQYDDYTWTLVSPVTESHLVHGHGRHTDLTTLMQKLDKYQPDTEVTIPTKYVFIVTEKKALNYWQQVKLPDGEWEYTDVSIATARKGFPTDRAYKSTTYYSTFRPIMESKAYYWARTLQQLYPYEMTTYYEDEYLVCYRLTQNTNELFNLAINYGLNANIVNAEDAAAATEAVPATAPLSVGAAFAQGRHIEQLADSALELLRSLTEGSGRP